MQEKRDQYLYRGKGGKHIQKILNILQMEIDNLYETKPSEEDLAKRKKEEDRFWGSSIPEDTNNEPPNENK